MLLHQTLNAGTNAQPAKEQRPTATGAAQNCGQGRALATGMRCTDQACLVAACQAAWQLAQESLKSTGQLAALAWLGEHVRRQWIRPRAAGAASPAMCPFNAALCDNQAAPYASKHTRRSQLL